MDDMIKKLLRSPEHQRLFKQRKEPPPAKGKAPAKTATCIAWKKLIADTGRIASLTWTPWQTVSQK